MQMTEPIPDHDRECWALAELARQAATEPSDICRRFGEVAMKVCDAASAGVQLLDGECFRWEVLVGAHASQRSRLIPRAGCPSALCIDDGRSRRVVLSARAYPELACEPPVVEAVVVPFTAGREALGAAWIMTDRTDRHFGAEDERMLRVLADVASACWDQWKSARAAVAESRRRDEIFATLVHELRNPLAAITAAACVIGRTTPPDAPAGQRAIDVVARQSRVLSRIVDDLSDLSRIACDKLQLRLQVLDIQPIVADAIVAAQPRIDARGQTLLITMPTEGLPCRIDAVRLAQILGNLLDNASKYTPDGGHISLTVVGRSATVDIRVRDDGVGIPPDKLREIFQPFTQLRSVDARPREGLGLGLALAETLTRMLGGRIQVWSAGPGAGAEFTVSLPRPTSRC